MKRLIAAAALLCLSVVAANAQAFGVTKSTPLDQLQASKAADADALWLITPPNPNAAFASYGVNYSETMEFAAWVGRRSSTMSKPESTRPMMS